MECRCGEKESVSGKIRHLSDALVKLSAYDASIASMRGKIDTAKSDFLLTISSDFVTSISNNLEKIPVEFASVSASARPKIEAKIIELNRQLRSLEEEDRAYHEELERQKKKINNDIHSE